MQRRRAGEFARRQIAKNRRASSRQRALPGDPWMLARAAAIEPSFASSPIASRSARTKVTSVMPMKPSSAQMRLLRVHHLWRPLAVKAAARQDDDGVFVRQQPLRTGLAIGEGDSGPQHIVEPDGTPICMSFPGQPCPCGGVSALALYALSALGKPLGNVEPEQFGEFAGGTVLRVAAGAQSGELLARLVI